MLPPESYNELKRLKEVKEYCQLPHWEKRAKDIRDIANKASRLCKVCGVSISLVDEERQVVKYSHSLSFQECPRKMSIDGHAILSSQYFILLDASTDWRFENNPLVKNYPKIKLYVGVPLVGKNGNTIGILSIFDGFPRTEFDSNYLYELQILSRELMAILNSPETDAVEEAASQSASIVDQIGRATSNTNMRTSKFPLPVYEKDGSGNAYNQNYHFRFGKHEQSDQAIINKEIWEKITNADNFRDSAKSLCQTISEKCDCDFIYIMEIRVTEVFKISCDFFPKVNEVDAENFKYVDKLHRVEKEHVTTRVVHGFPVKEASRLEDLQLESYKALHYRALSSEFGIFIRSKVRNSKYANGICMPFYRATSKLVRKQKRRNFVDGAPIDLYLKSGGFIIGAFTDRDTEITHDDINYILNGANIFRIVCLQ